MYALNNKLKNPTRRELEILQCIASGQSSKQIAHELCISKATVDNHRKNLLKKTGAKNSNELVSKMYNNITGIKNSH